MTPDLNDDYCKREREKKGEDNKRDGKKTTKYSRDLYIGTSYDLEVHSRFFFLGAYEYLVCCCTLSEGKIMVLLR